MPSEADYLSTDWIFMYPSRFLNWKWAFVPITVIWVAAFIIPLVGIYLEGHTIAELGRGIWYFVIVLVSGIYFTGNYFRKARWPLQFQRDGEGLRCIPIWGKAWKIKWEDITLIEDAPKKWSIKIYANVPWRRRYYFYIQKDLDGFKYLVETFREYVRECEI